MSAKMETLKTEEVSLLHTINWMNEVWEDKVHVINVDFPSGSVHLYGAADDTSAFREILNKVMTEIYQRTPAWREL
jgi:hypothetical protein